MIIHLRSRSGVLVYMFLMVFSLARVADANVTELYARSCLACHGVHGVGVMPGVPDLSGVNGPLSRPDEALISAILAGGSSTPGSVPMPPKGRNPDLTETGIRALLDYMHSNFFENVLLETISYSRQLLAPTRSG